jgi:hypothetical protein
VGAQGKGMPGCSLLSHQFVTDSQHILSVLISDLENRRIMMLFFQSPLSSLCKEVNSQKV